MDSIFCWSRQFMWRQVVFKVDSPKDRWLQKEKVWQGWQLDELPLKFQGDKGDRWHDPLVAAGCRRGARGGGALAAVRTPLAQGETCRSSWQEKTFRSSCQETFRSSGLSPHVSASTVWQVQGCKNLRPEPCITSTLKMYHKYYKCITNVVHYKGNRLSEKLRSSLK